MKVKPIRNERDYDWALREIAKYFDKEPRPRTPAADRFDVLASLIRDYEERHWPIEAPDPVSAILYRMEESGLSQADLARLLGSRSRASEILGRKRPLTLAMASKLHRQWKIPAEALIG
ncbi:MAG: XRE family transcriptional regulator [Alphaproteobacteria bacterium]|nr:XRE family transcriptional regulator [Alphaproteobacteria bacterium]